ncbi:MAG: high-affinity branched-chain amino acid ABC transporter permease LivM [Alphaproteobacteria bacterium]
MADAASAPASPDVPWPRIVRESALTALVVLGLTVLMVGVRIVDVPSGIAIRTRLDDVLAIVLLAFIGRFSFALTREGRPVLGLAVAVPVALALSAIALAAGMSEGPDALGLAAANPFESAVVLAVTALTAWAIAGQAALRAFRRAVPLDAEAQDARRVRMEARLRLGMRALGPVLLVLAVVYPFLPMMDRRGLDLGVLILTYVMLGWGLNIVVGLAGLLDLGYVAFYAVGAYSFALLSHYFGLSFWICLPYAGIMAAFGGMLLGFPVLRLRGDYLAIVTLGFGEMIRITLLNWYTFTGGPNGIGSIPRPSFFGLEFTRNAPEGVETFHSLFDLEYSTDHRLIFLYFVILGLALLTNAFTLRIRKLPIGRAWEALREDEIASRSLGINPRNTKLTSFAIGAMFGGFAGAFFATRQGFISPESFVFLESAIILAVVVLGGFGSQLGIVIAAIVLIGLPEWFRELQNYRMLAFGAAMVLIMIWRPHGLIANREPTIRLGAGSGREGR